MNDFNQINGTNNFAQFGLTEPANQGPSNQVNQEDFLTLLIAQINNTNPLDPQDGTDFVAQLASIGTVDGIQNLQQSFESLSASLQSSQALQASALVGRSVQVPANTVNLTEEGSPRASFILPQNASSLNVSILNANGEIVQQVALGPTTAGTIPFTWDGITSNGDRAPAGNYQLRAEAQINGEVTGLNSLVLANVDSVSIDQQRGLILNLAGAGSVPFNQVSLIAE
ncbi:MAG: flagellar hook assembly protein FlgD [Gammaproteobacteria bacterium]